MSEIDDSSAKLADRLIAGIREREGMLWEDINQWLRSELVKDNSRIWGELILDSQGEAHFICHTKDDDFLTAREAIKKFIALLQQQLTNEKSCPFYQGDLHK